MYEDAYAGEPFVELAPAPAEVRDVRETNVCRLHVAAQRAHRQGGRALGDRQPVEGHLLAGGAEPESDVRLRRGNEGCGERSTRRPAGGPAAAAVLHSRWVPAPAHVRDLGPDAGLPAGFRAAGVACGIKPSGNPDLGLLVCDAERPVSAARFTASATPAAPVLLSQRALPPGALRAMLANSGCANAATGTARLDDAAKTQGAAAMALGCRESEVLLGSTGGISEYLPVEQMLQGHPRPLAGSCAATATATSSRRSRRPTPSRSAPTWRCSCSPGRCGCRPVQGGGDDLAELRHDAVLRADRRGAGARHGGAAAGRVREALVRPLLGGRAALHQRHRGADVLRAKAASRSRPRARTSCASARRWTRCCASWRS